MVEGADEPNWPLDIRLRLALKRMLRGLHLRCLSIGPAPEVTSDAASEPPPPYRGPTAKR